MFKTMALAGRSLVPHSSQARHLKLVVTSGELIVTPACIVDRLSTNGFKNVNIFGFWYPNHSPASKRLSAHQRL